MVEEFFHFKDELDKIAVCYGDYWNTIQSCTFQKDATVTISILQNVIYCWYICNMFSLIDIELNIFTWILEKKIKFLWMWAK